MWWFCLLVSFVTDRLSITYTTSPIPSYYYRVSLLCWYNIYLVCFQSRGRFTPTLLVRSFIRFPSFILSLSLLPCHSFNSRCCVHCYSSYTLNHTLSFYDSTFPSFESIVILRAVSSTLLQWFRVVYFPLSLLLLESRSFSSPLLYYHRYHHHV